MKDCTVRCNCPTNTNSLIRVNVLYITVIDQVEDHVSHSKRSVQRRPKQLDHK